MNKRIKKKHSKNQILKRGDYAVIQDGTNNHVLVFKYGNLVSSTPQEKRLTKKQLKQEIDEYEELWTRLKYIKKSVTNGFGELLHHGTGRTKSRVRNRESPFHT